MHHRPTLRTRVLACAAALLVAAVPACKSSTGSDAYPAMIHSCETNTATLCADWKKTGQPGHYVADWSQGSHAEIVVATFEKNSVVFIRDDPSGTSAGMHAFYSGPRTGNAVNGTVTWTHNGQTFSGTWTATW